MRLAAIACSEAKGGGRNDEVLEVEGRLAAEGEAAVGD